MIIKRTDKYAITFRKF